MSWLKGSTSSQEELGSWDAPLAMMLNPVVTVRSKGVMEKCNFCIQRTRDIREDEKRSGKRYNEDKLTSACAQTCPTEAITFGDINDPFSKVSQVIDSSPHKHKVLDYEINTRPAITYLGHVRNRPSTEAEYDPLDKSHAKDSHGKDDHGKKDDHDNEGGDH